MSLINDALKRAQQAQNDGPRPAALEPLRPVERAPQARRPTGLLLLPAVIVCLIVITLVLLWRSSASNGSGLPVRAANNEARTKSILAPEAARASQSGAAPAAQSITSVPPESQPPPAASSSAPSPTPAATGPQSGVATGNALAAATETPAPLRLQGIMLDPANPAVIIGGKTLFIGDQFGQWRIAAITRETATLVGGGQTNVLSLPQ